MKAFQNDDGTCEKCGKTEHRIVSGGAHAPGGTSVIFSGYYVYATWYLTGESRAEAYHSYPEEFNAPATFGQTKILHPVSAGGPGAWEVAARFSEINLNDGSVLFAQ